METLLSEFYSNLSNDQKLLYSEIADFVIELGYKPKKAKTKSLNKGELNGYEYVYPDGCKFYRCGSKLISLPQFTHVDVPEILSLLKTQHLYYIGNCNF